jgi:hypothetical protein
MMQNLAEIREYWHNAHEMDSLPQDYLSWQASRKQAFLWENKILQSKYDKLPPLQGIDVIGLFLTRLKNKMDWLSDQTPPKWRKAIHAHGSIAKIKFIPASDTPFTGLFQGADCGLVRLSLVGDPTRRGFAPGLAIKWLVDGQPSADFSALVSLAGQGKNSNFFAHEFSNVVPTVNQIGPKLINLIFRRVSKYPTKISLQDLGSVDQLGQSIPTPCYPEQVFLVPSSSVQFSEHSSSDFRDELTSIPTETLLFSIYAVDPRKIKMGDETSALPDYRQHAQHIGDIISASEFVSSFYGDSQLFFRHHRFRDQ